QIGQLSANIMGMNAKLAETASISRQITVDAKSGEKSLSNMNESMSTITQSSHEMTGIVGMINDISDRINLLSLNAAIEAARAGESGRGFAVVADEISKLAEQTASSIKDISRFITSNNDEITSGIACVDSASATISSVITGVGRINEMLNALTDFMQVQLNANSAVNSAATVVQKRSEEIRIATEEQKIAFAEIVKSIALINDNTQANAAGAVELAAEADGFSSTADGLKKTVDYFKV
ncbi:MAG: methyl-accepting chemotaxis protein, partial [Spirochaetota bacterium]